MPGNQYHRIRAVLLLMALGLLVGCQQRTPPAPAQRAIKKKIKKKKSRQQRVAVDVDLTTLQGRTVLVVTHPSRKILDSLVTLVEKKLLDIPDLFVVGVYHDDERESYVPSRKYVEKNGLSWLGLKGLSCPLTADNLHTDNPCSGEFKALLDKSAGMMFTGGSDIPPALYGEKTLLTTAIRTPRRHYWEVSLLSHLLGSSRNPGFKPLLQSRPGYPVLAICLGLQTMNVATGGTLYQDIFSEIYGVETIEGILELDPDQMHRNAHYYLDPADGVWPGVFHLIRFTGADRWWRSLLPDGNPVKVMSAHHQAIEKLGQDLEIIATSTDGKVVEAVRHTRFLNVLGIQFHPEYNVIWDEAVAARRRRSDSQRNAFRSRLVDDERAQAFHRALWQRISARFASSGRGGNAD